MAERIAAGLWPDGQAVRLEGHRGGSDPAGPGIDVVDDVVEPTRQPEPFSVGAHIAHVGAAAAWDRPGLLDRAGREIDDRDAAPAVRRRARRVRAAVGDVELGRIA